MNKEIKNSFELKHEKLIKVEKEIKDKLDNEVTKIKNQRKIRRIFIFD